MPTVDLFLGDLVLVASPPETAKCNDNPPTWVQDWQGTRRAAYHTLVLLEQLKRLVAVLKKFSKDLLPREPSSKSADFELL